MILGLFLFAFSECLYLYPITQVEANQAQIEDLKRNLHDAIERDGYSDSATVLRSDYVSHIYLGIIFSYVRRLLH